MALDTKTSIVGTTTTDLHLTGVIITYIISDLQRFIYLSLLLITISYF